MPQVVAPQSPRKPRIPEELFGDTPKARKRIQRLRLIDKVISTVITVGGIAIVLAVLGIFVFVVKEAVPLMLPATVTAEPSISDGAGGGRPLAVGENEHREVGWVASSKGFIRLLDFPGQRVIGEVPIDGLGTAKITSGGRASRVDVVAVGTDDGRVLAAGIAYEDVFVAGRRLPQKISVAWQAELPLPASGHAVTKVAVAADEEHVVVAASGEGFIAVARRSVLGTKVKSSDLTALLPQGSITALALDERGENLVVGGADGAVFRIALDGVDGKLVEHVTAGTAPVTALAYALGSQTLLVGDARGAISGWQGIRSGDGAAQSLSRVREFESLPSAVTAFAPSARNKCFLAVGRDGTVRMDHVTTERTIATVPAVPGAEAFELAPRSNGASVGDADGAIHHVGIDAPHPDVTFGSLFLPVLYEGYDRPEFVWQSSGGTDDVEPKFSLVPLIVGSLKGVLYAMLFSAPLAILAALYTSQFASARLRGVVKPTVELLGAMPSVVVGFLAGLWLAPTVDKNLAGAFLMIALIPAAIGLAFVVLKLLPVKTRRRLALGRELPFLIPFVLGGAVAAFLLAPPVEQWFFNGSLREFLTETLHFAYDPRNALIVGIALGVAVIPIVFTVSEDALSNVPLSLRAASAALGASRWQTAVRLVLPAASPGVFAALMLGFGRAIGETMIVVMATGNTPILDWSPFNGMRTISACIATEIPEAPVGGSLYRVLFLAGGFLFLFAFLCNTAAETIGTRLRKRFARW